MTPGGSARPAILLLCSSFAAMCCWSSPTVQAQENFFAGKQISIVVGFGPGGGVDSYARTVAQFVGGHIPGNPTVIVRNLPGAAGLKAVMSLATPAAQDGTTLVAFNPAIVVQSLTMPDKIKVDFSRLNWLGSADEDLRICYVWGATGIKTFQDMLARGQVIMANSGGGSSSIEQKILRNILGVKLKQVLGYGGSADKQLAVERGEVDGDCGAWTGTPEQWIRDGKINLVTQFQDHVSHGLPASVPYVGDLIRDQHQKELLGLLMAGADIGRPYVTAKSVPAERVRILRDAFDKTMTDPRFLAAADQRGQSMTRRREPRSRTR